MTGDEKLLDDQGTNGSDIALSISNRPLSDVLLSVEKRYICAVLNAAGGNKAEAARRAGLTYQTFVRKLQSHNLRVTYHAD